MMRSKVLAAVTVLGCAGVASLIGAPSAHAAGAQIKVKNCRAPVVGGAGKRIVVSNNLVCSPADIAMWPANATTFITVGVGGRLELGSKSISLIPNPASGRAITAVQLRGAGVASGSSCAPATISGFARALHVVGSGNRASGLSLNQNVLMPIPVGTAGKLAAAAVVIEGGHDNRLEGVDVTGSYAEAPSDIATAILLWGEPGRVSSAHRLENLSITGNFLSALQGATPAPALNPGDTPVAPPGPPAVTDPTPDGGGIGQTLSTAIMVWGASVGSSINHRLEDILISDNLIASRTATTAGLGGILSLEATTGTRIENVSIEHNAVSANSGVQAGPDFIATESQAGILSLTESSSNILSDVWAANNAAISNRSAGGVVLAVGTLNSFSNVSIEANSFVAGSFTGALFLYGEPGTATRLNGGNAIDGISIAHNFLQGFSGGAAVFLTGAFTNNLTNIGISDNVFVPFGFDVFDLGLGFPNSSLCSAAPFSTAFVPFPQPPLNYWSGVSGISALPECALN